jgi:hypothetical protein
MCPGRLSEPGRVVTTSIAICAAGPANGWTGAGLGAVRVDASRAAAGAGLTTNSAGLDILGQYLEAGRHGARQPGRAGTANPRRRLIA